MIERTHRPRRARRYRLARDGGGGRGRAAARSSSTASPAPRRTSPTGSTRSPSSGWHVGRPRPAGPRRQRASPTTRRPTPSTRSPPTCSACSTRSAGTSAVALGHSMGGMVAADRGRCARPSASTALVLMDTSHRALRGVDPGVVELGVAIARDGGHRRGDGRPGRAWRGGTLGTAAHQRLLATRPGYKRVRRPQDAGVVAGHVRRHAPGHHRPGGGVDRLDRPAARRGAHAGARGRARTRRSSSRRSAWPRPSPARSSSVIPDAGHSPQFENPEPWWKALTAFLDRLLAWPATGPCRGSARSRRRPG